MIKRNRHLIYNIVIVIILGLLLSSLSAAETIERKRENRTDSVQLVCSIERPVIVSGESVPVRAWISGADSKGERSQALWTVPVGKIVTSQNKSTWGFQGVSAGKYSAAVRIPFLNISSCTVTVRVEDPSKSEPERGPNLRRTGWYFLLDGKSEVKGYGLYSYLLFASPPHDQESRSRYLKIIEAYLTYLPHIKQLEKYFLPTDLNITYLPLTKGPPKKITPQWVLEHYDYARALHLLRDAPEISKDGPYLLSTFNPLSNNPLTKPYLKQDLAHVPPDLVWAWTREFLNQTAQEHFWEEKSLTKIQLNLRTTVAILAKGLPAVTSALDTWIGKVK